MFSKQSKDGYKTPATGVQMKTVNYGEKTLMTEFRLKKGSSVPAHSHYHEQTGYLISGRMELVIGSETYKVEPGDSWNIPSHTEHFATVIEDSVAIEVFSPVREDYLP